MSKYLACASTCWLSIKYIDLTIYGIGFRNFRIEIHFALSWATKLIHSPHPGPTKQLIRNGITS